MGGHSKKAGKGGGGGGNRGKHLEARKKVSKDPGVPDLKELGRKLVQAAQKKSHSVASIRGVSNPGRHFDFPSRRPPTIIVRDQDGNPDDSKRNEMRRLALHTTERQFAYQGAESVEGEEDDGFSAYHQHTDLSMRRFLKEFQRVVEHCDVILQVVDARDPLGCRLTDAERSIRSSFGDRKHIVIVLNKVDLLPSKEVVDAWVHYFESSEGVMCIPFAAKGPQGQTYINDMFRRLRSLARNEENGERKAIVVGVIGYPNVGKSSIINALKRKNVVGVGNMPGFTTGNTEVELRSDIRVMDCPGVVSPGEDTGDVILRNAVKVSDVANPFLAVERLIQRCSNAGMHAEAEEEEGVSSYASVQGHLHPLGLFYGIGSFPPEDTMEFIRLVGLRRGRLMKGGAVDEEETARMILHDWNDGRIPYFTLPPDLDELTQFKSTVQDGDGAEEEYAPQLVTRAKQGVTLDGLPTFHLVFSRIAEGLGGSKKSYMR